MKAIGLIVQREFFSRVKTKTFILTTILTPLLFIAIGALPTILLMLSSNDDISKVYVIDRTGNYFDLLNSSEDYEFINLTNDENKDRDKAAALLEITDDLNKNPKAVTFFSEKQQPPRELTAYINKVLSESVRKKKIEEFSEKSNIEPEQIAELQQIINEKNAVQISTIRWDETGQEKETLGDAASFIGMALTFCMFFFITMYSSLVLQSVIEEKSNRIIEVIISSVRPFDLMMGKIIGVGLVGLLQLLIWVVIGGISLTVMQMFIGGQLAEAQQAMSMVQTDPEMLADISGIINGINWIQVAFCLVIYFIGGYLLFSSLYAMFGSGANDAQEAQQLNMPLTILLLVSFYAGFAAAKNPEGSMAFWCSIIPFTSPVVMMVRAPFEIPIWELALSIVLLFVTAVLMVKLAAKIYRVGILMYGKKITIPEMLKWLKYK